MRELNRASICIAMVLGCSVDDPSPLAADDATRMIQGPTDDSINPPESKETEPEETEPEETEPETTATPEPKAPDGGPEPVATVEDAAGPVVDDGGTRTVTADAGDTITQVPAPELRQLGAGCLEDSDCGSGNCEVAALGEDVRICCASPCRSTEYLCLPVTGDKCCSPGADGRANPDRCNSFSSDSPIQAKPVANGEECGTDDDCLSGFCEVGGLGSSNYNICCAEQCNGLTPSCVPGGDYCEPI